MLRFWLAATEVQAIGAAEPEALSGPVIVPEARLEIAEGFTGPEAAVR
jgi:hypothetical protein